MTRFHALAAVLAATIITGSSPAYAADFYETQLRLGAESYRAGRIVEAIDYLRIANFGLLERTDLLAEGLARLAMAEAAAGRADDLKKTLTRFLAIERQYPSWQNVAMTGDDRAAFEKLLLATMPRDSVASVPALAGLATPPASEAPELTPEQQRRQLQQKAAADPSNPEWPLALARDARARRDDKAALRWCDKALRADPAAYEARAMRLAIFVARKDDKAALGELRTIPEEAWSAQPGIAADAFVVYARTKNFAQADAVASRLREGDAAREDVAAEVAALAGWRQAQMPVEGSASAEPAPASPSSEPVAAPAVPVVAVPAATNPEPQVPPSAPVAGPGDVADARNEVSRGSFTGAQDRVGTTLASAKKLMSANRPVDAQRLLRDELVKTPGSRELRLAMIEASCLARDWRTGEAQLGLVEPFRKGEDRYRFYAAVVLFESGKHDPARTLMAQAAPSLAASPYVDYYVKAILGE